MSKGFEDGNGSTDFGERAIDAFLAISGLYLATTELLTAINATAARGAMAGSGSAINDLADTTTVSDWKLVQFDFTAPLIDGAFAYAQSLQDLTTQTRNEFTSMLPALLRASDQELPNANSWPEIIAMFARSAPHGKSGNASPTRQSSGRPRDHD